MSIQNAAEFSHAIMTTTLKRIKMSKRMLTPNQENGEAFASYIGAYTTLMLIDHPYQEFVGKTALQLSKTPYVMELMTKIVEDYEKSNS